MKAGAAQQPGERPIGRHWATHRMASPAPHYRRREQQLLSALLRKQGQRICQIARWDGECGRGGNRPARP
jgi:hypothetical protein